VHYLSVFQYLKEEKKPKYRKYAISGTCTPEELKVNKCQSSRKTLGKPSETDLNAN
jgi:hypothetical protein